MDAWQKLGMEAFQTSITTRTKLPVLTLLCATQ